ncbi:hypothetical protein N0V93_007860 [Gnomoniopsis smithogilvyi]|uniref:Uncharacterized protein n=1 Tax=Gnomoniopsis smithogilvyi TaxID=1191159 RepID=A0A9W9CTC5_9PEZI|nr:hypothetical protein N0V93_007860 [Gnomoniopsis smithogilvyi]
MNPRDTEIFAIRRAGHYVKHHNAALDERDVVERLLTATDPSIWEKHAVAILAPSLRSRRWIAQQGIFEIDLVVFLLNGLLPAPASTAQYGTFWNRESVINSEMNSSRFSPHPVDRGDEADETFQSTPAFSEVENKAEGETDSDETATDSITRAIGDEVASIIPGTEDFDDVAALLRAVETNLSNSDEPEAFHGTDHQVNTEAPRDSGPWESLDRILAMTKRKSAV